MRLCDECQSHMPYGFGFPGRICQKCRAKRSATTNRAKAERHGPDYFDRRSKDARRQPRP